MTSFRRQLLWRSARARRATGGGGFATGGGGFATGGGGFATGGGGFATGGGGFATGGGGFATGGGGFATGGGGFATGGGGFATGGGGFATGGGGFATGVGGFATGVGGFDVARKQVAASESFSFCTADDNGATQKSTPVPLASFGNTSRWWGSAKDSGGGVSGQFHSPPQSVDRRSVRVQIPKRDAVPKVNTCWVALVGMPASKWSEVKAGLEPLTGPIDKWILTNQRTHLVKFRQTSIAQKCLVMSGCVIAGLVLESAWPTRELFVALKSQPSFTVIDANGVDHPNLDIAVIQDWTPSSFPQPIDQQALLKKATPLFLGSDSLRMSLLRRMICWFDVGRLLWPIYDL
eukprot:CAMPEP_0113857290 /NCGR_PEP_ID=MMETSP0372-20130328/10039_1 /TAXON_ID=340204 /ORGANISM="Lankesteria abbotti" /LENGTH=347 /DNA_ID=CAMNT_0000833045 /DNA_START=207 /DNA_END=1250 /DNA_ORIENTATION=- /assembly_acc=CAM_ASM_000359